MQLANDVILGNAVHQVVKAVDQPAHGGVAAETVVCNRDIVYKSDRAHGLHLNSHCHAIRWQA